MLEIFVNDQKVDLPSDIQVSLIIENPLMHADRIPAPYSLSFTLPPTPRNLSIFKNPNRAASYGAATGAIHQVPARILFNPVTIAQGSLLTTEYDGGIKVAFSGIDNLGDIKKVLSSVDLDVLAFPTSNFRDIQFDNPSNYAGQYKLMAENAAQGLDNRFVVAPVRVATENDPVQFVRWEFGRLGPRPVRYSPQQLMNSEFVNFYNPATDELMIRSLDYDPRIGLWYGYHASVFPFLRVHYLLAKIFGDTLINNIFEVGELSDLVIPSTYFSNWHANGLGGVGADGYGWLLFDPFTYGPGFAADLSISLAEFLPAMGAPDWFKDLVKLFAVSVFNKFGRFEIVLNKDVLNDPGFIEWDHKLIGKPALSMARGQSYRYGYRNVDAAEAPADTIPVPDMNSLLNFPATDPGDEQRAVFRVTSTGQLYERNIFHEEGESPSDPGTVFVSFELLNPAYGGSPEQTSADVYDAMTNIKPIPLMPKEYWTQPTDPDKYWFVVPYSEIERTPRPEDASIGFFRGMVNAKTSGHQYPLVSPYNINPDGSQTGDLSLCWDGEDGLIENFHSEFRDWMERDKLRLRANFLLSERDLNNLDLKKKVHLEGRNFFIEKIQVTIRHNRIDPAIVDLIEA